VWKQLEDLLRRSFLMADGGVYSHLFRHIRLVASGSSR
jgi:hypothetical protein